MESDEWSRGALAAWIRRVSLDLPVTGSLAEPYRLSLDGDDAAAVDFWQERGCGFDAALVLVDSGDEASLRLALRGFEALGATAAVQAVRRAMRRSGVRSIPSGSHASTRSDPLGLTGREREVLDLISAGNTNAEISQYLVISVKTVDHHVSAVLAKLGVPSRRLAAATAIRLGLVGSPDV